MVAAAQATHVVLVGGVVRKIGSFQECANYALANGGVVRPKWHGTEPKAQHAVQQLAMQDQKDANAKAFYAVYNIRTKEARVFTSWAEAEPYVKRQPVEHKKFSTRQAAEEFLLGRQEAPKQQNPKPVVAVSTDDSPPW